MRGLLRTAVDDDNPVLWADHVKLFDYVDPVPDAPEAIPFGVADIKRAGTDVTIVGTSLMVRRALEAAEIAGRGRHLGGGGRPAHPGAA